MADHRRGTGEFRGGELRHLHHVPVFAAHVVTEHVLQVAAALGLGLHVDVAHLTALIGQAGVVATGQHGNRLHCLLEVDVESAKNRAINRQA